MVITDIPRRELAFEAKAAQWAALVLGAGMPGLAAALERTLQPAVSSFAHDFHGLHEYVMLFATVLFVGVFGFMFYSVVAHRNSKRYKAKQFHENTTVEIIWTVFPAMMLVVIAWPAAKTVVAQKNTSNPEVTIKVTGYQRNRGYDHIEGKGEGISFISSTTTLREQIEGRAAKGRNYLLEVDEPVIAPLGKKVRVVTTAADVVQSPRIPTFGKQLSDAEPASAITYTRNSWGNETDEAVQPAKVRALRQ